MSYGCNFSIADGSEKQNVDTDSHLKLRQRHLDIKNKVWTRKLQKGAVVSTDALVPPPVSHFSRKSADFRERQGWRKHASDSGYSTGGGSAASWRETEEERVPSIFPNPCEVDNVVHVCPKAPPKLRHFCRRENVEKKDASSQCDFPEDFPTHHFHKHVNLLHSDVSTLQLNDVSWHRPIDLLAPPPADRIAQCRVVRERNVFGLNFYPLYKLHLEKDGLLGPLLLYGRKRKKSPFSKYLIFTGGEDLSKRSPSIVGKLRANLVGTRFHLKSFKRSDLNEMDSMLLFYETNFLGTKGPRKMRVLLPKDACSLESVRQIDSLESCWNLRSGNVVQLVSIEPEWDDKALAHILYFQGRITRSSVKNFQLCQPPEDEVLLQFGRIGRDEFRLDFQRPLNAVQAFAIALSSLDLKIGCD